jgi:hypothetical protein
MMPSGGSAGFASNRILAEEQAVLDLVDARDDRALLWVKDAAVRHGRNVRHGRSGFHAPRSQNPDRESGSVD